jgi:hypothetical protein
MSDYRKQQVEHLDSMKDNYSKKKKKKKGSSVHNMMEKRSWVTMEKMDILKLETGLYSMRKEEEYRGKGRPIFCV